MKEPIPEKLDEYSNRHSRLKVLCILKKIAFKVELLEQVADIMNSTGFTECG